MISTYGVKGIEYLLRKVEVVTVDNQSQRQSPYSSRNAPLQEKPELDVIFRLVNLLQSEVERLEVKLSTRVHVRFLCLIQLLSKRMELMHSTQHRAFHCLVKYEDILCRCRDARNKRTIPCCGGEQCKQQWTGV